jgi:hypothetical protein
VNLIVPVVVIPVVWKWEYSAVVVAAQVDGMTVKTPR